jgi:ribonucleotide reductase alpha subunit
LTDLTGFHRALADDPLIQMVWRDKYRFGNEATAADTARRVVNALYADDPSEEAREVALRHITAGTLIPAGRIMAGAGTGRAVTLINCYVSPTMDDSMGGIHDVIKGAALTMQQGGGIGTDYSPVRPRGALVRRTGSVASGVLSFADEQNAMCDTVVSAGTRRGAMMMTLRDDHPDLWNPDHLETYTDELGRTALKSPSFITAKRDPWRLRRFNVSVLVSDAFMRAVAADATWDLGFHVPPADWEVVGVESRALLADDGEGRKAGEMAPWYVYRRVPARVIWEGIMRSTYTYAEPGIIFIDRVNDRNNLNYCEDIRSTNPCFTGDTKVWTDRGPRRFDELAENGADVRVLTETEDGRLAYRTMTRPRMTQRSTSVVEVTILAKRGMGGRIESVTTLRCTPDHEFYLVGGAKCRAIDLQPHDRVESAYRTKANQKGYISVRSTSGDHLMEHYLTAEADHGRRPSWPAEHGHHLNGIKDDNAVGNIEIVDGGEHNSFHMTGDGNPMRKWYPNATEEERQRYHENMSTSTSGENNGMFGRRHADATLEKIGAKTRERNADPDYRARHAAAVRAAYARKRAEATNHRVIGVHRLDGVADVYCGTVPDTGRFFVSLGEDHYEGVLVSNCGEQPLPPNGACCLGSVNLARMVIDPFGADAQIDFDMFDEVVACGVRTLDNVLDVTGYPLEAQRLESMNKRRIGLGVTGFADMLAQLEIPYGSPPSLQVATTVARRLKMKSYAASVALGRERGPFPLFDEDGFSSSWNLRDEPAGESLKKLRRAVRDHGIRNGVLNTVAPNGTISIAFGGDCAGGIEPFYAFEMQRNVRMPDDTRLTVRSVPYAYRLYEHLVGPTAVADLPAYFVKAADVPPLAHVAVQGRWQEHIDASISKTVNVGSDVAFEDFRDVYTAAYAAGCKGCTTYRYDPAAGRGQVLIDTSEATAAAPSKPPEQESKGVASDVIRPRADRVDGSTYKVKWPLTGVNWYVHVTRDQGGELLEVFVSTRDAQHQEWVQAFSCLVTAVLRRGGDTRFLTDELKSVTASNGGAFLRIGDAEHPTRYPSIVAAIGAVVDAERRRLASGASVVASAVATAMSQVLTKFVGAGGGKLACESCGSAELKHESGCVTCLTCGHSTCG